jgi:hypothetical protein
MTTSTFEGIAFGPNSAGSFDFDRTNTSATADNAVAVTLTTSGELASGYDQGVYVALNISGTTTGGNATQRNAFAADISIAGSHASWIGGAYYYIAGSSSPTLSSAYVYGVKIDFDRTLTTACDYSCNLSLSRSSSKAAGVDCFIELELNSSAAVTTSVVNMQGQTRPSYFVTLSHNDVHGFWSNRAMDAATSTAALAMRVGSTRVVYIPVYAATA